MAIEIFNRYEHKYLLYEAAFSEVQAVLEAHMEKDAYNRNGDFYTVSNIYFDTPGYDLIRSSLMKPVFKEKLRLRSYGICGAEELAFLEIKKKYKGLVNKRRTKIQQKQAYSFVSSGKAEVMDYMNRQVVSELAYFMETHRLEPKAYIAYDRLAYFEVGNPDLRISFDRNIRGRSESLNLWTGDSGTLLLPDNLYLMEIKTQFAMPLWLSRLLTEQGLHKTSFSKYGTFYKEQLQAETDAECVNF